MKRFLIVVAIAVAGAAFVWYLAAPDPVPVAVVVAERGPVAATVANTRAGTVNTCRRAQLAPALGGQIALLPVSDGDHVEAGDLLLELWNEDLRAQLELAERDAQAASSRATETCVLADVARREADRTARLREQRLVSEEAAERAEATAQSSSAACAATRDAARVSEARVDVARAQLERTRLRAPFPGVIAEINGEVGEFVTPSPVGIPTPPTVDLIDPTCLYISAPIDEVDAPRIEPGMPARITLDAFPGHAFDGHVRRVAPYVQTAEQQARTVEIEAEIDDPDKGKLLPGYSADVEVLLERRDGVVRVPTSVLIAGNRVLVLDPDEGVIEARDLTTGISNWEYTEVIDGVREGEWVVSSIDREGVRPGARARPE